MFLKKHCNSAFIPAESISQLFLELNLYSFVLKKTKNWHFPPYSMYKFYDIPPLRSYLPQKEINIDKNN